MGEVLKFSESYRKLPIVKVELPQTGNIKKFRGAFVERQFEDFVHSCVAAFVHAEEQCLLLTHTFEIYNPRPVEPALTAVHEFGVEIERLLKYLQAKNSDVLIMPTVQGCYSFASELKKLLARIERSARSEKSALVPCIEVNDKIRYARQALTSIFPVPQRTPAQK